LIFSGLFVFSADAFLQKLVVDFFQQGGGAGLILRWSGPGVPKLVPIPASAFRFNPNERLGDGHLKYNRARAGMNAEVMAIL
jgi:hypothetical protein